MIVYEGIGPEKDTVVTEDVALDFCIERLRNDTKDAQDEFIEWYLSGNFIKKEEEE